MPEAGGGISVLVRFAAAPIANRAELDLWAGERWLRRLKLKTGTRSQLGSYLWKAAVTDVEHVMIDALRLELVSGSNHDRP
jgi:hypothetical protein